MPFYEMIESFCERINNSIHNYYLGRITASYNELAAGLNHILWNSSLLFASGVQEVKAGDLKLYRLRRGEGKFNQRDMFHIPFEKRDLVSTQRYSIPGHPSLYLGDSVYVCWEELGQPPIDEVFASMFINTKLIRLIEILKTDDLKKRILLKENTDLSSEIFRFLLLYPLIISCSVRTKKRSASFKPEYILPQLFLQYVMEHKDKINGIKYFSTIISSDKVENVGTYNYVFPTKAIKQSGYCQELIDIFELTEPLLWKYEELSKGNVSFYGTSPRNDVKLELNTGYMVPYDWSTFRAIEVGLSYEVRKPSKLKST